MAVNDNEGQTYLPRTRKTRALMALLAMSSPKPMLRPQLASLLWSQRENEQARASLRQSVHELQDTLGASWSHVFVTDRHHLSLRGAQLEIDALLLAQPAQISPDLLDQVPMRCCSRTSTVLIRRSIAGWKTSAAGLFASAERSERVLLARYDDPLAAIEAAEQILVLDRRHEAAWRALIRCHAERGDIRAAVAAYDRCRGALAETADARPSPETEELIGRIRIQSQSAQSGQQPGMQSEAPLPIPPPLRSTAQRDRRTVRLRVVPLRTIGEERDDGLGIGLAEEISAGLSRFRWISCLPATLRPSGTPAGHSGGELC